MKHHSRVPAAFVALLLAGWTTLPLSAHPGSTSTVVIQARGPETLNVAIHTNAAALVTKLEDATGAPLGAQLDSPRELALRVKSLGAALLSQISLRVDGASTAPTIASVDVDASGQAVIHLVSPIPRDGRTFTWSTSLIYGAYPLAFRDLSHRETVRWLQGHTASNAIAIEGDTRPWTQTAARGIWLGFTHILPHGLDHILFVVGLFLLSAHVRPLLIQVSSFTLAHSVTLGLCLYGVVSVPSRIVEPLIALSVAYVGVENLFTSRLKPWRVAIVFAFGLLHGLGFAEALASLNLTRADLFSTLVSFNVGVELGQLAVIAVAASVLFCLVQVRHAAWRTPVTRAASAFVGAMGLIWTVERLLP